VGRQVKHVAVDLDDVTVDFVPGLLRSYAIEFDEVYEYSDPWGPEMVAFFTKGTPKLRAAGYGDAWEWLRERDWLWAQFPAVDGAIGGVSTLRERGLFVEALTSKPKWAEPQVYRWLGKWRPAFQRTTIVPVGESKLDYSDADLIIDDRLKTCVEFLEAGRQAIWFDRHDTGTKVPNGAWRARDWDGVIVNVNHITGRTG